MGINQFILDGKVKFDLTKDTVTADKLAKGITAHGSNGESIVGTATFDGGGGAGVELTTGMITPASDIEIGREEFHIAHGLSKPPEFFWIMTGQQISKNVLIQAVYKKDLWSGLLYALGKTVDTIKVKSTIDTNGAEVTVTNTEVIIRAYGPYVHMPSGFDYFWAAGSVT